MTVTDRRLDAAGALLRALALATQSASLYPAGHPQRRRLGGDLVGHTERLLERCRPEDPCLFVDRRSFYLGLTLLPRESLSLGRLAEDLERAGIESVVLTGAASADDFDLLLEILAGRAPWSSPTHGIRINAVAPAPRTEEPWERRLAELRRAYADGVTVLRRSGALVAAGEPIDLSAATAVVEQLHDEVARDPGYGLLLSAVKSYDEYTYFHMVNVCLLAVSLGQVIGLHREQVLVLGLGGLLHDIGKVFVPSDVLHTTGPLDEEQWRLVQRHPTDGAGLLLATGTGLYHPAASILLEHHAGYDRSGYPVLQGHDPSVPSRLVAVADCFDAVTSRRSYREPLDRHGALRVLRSAAGRGLDPDAVAAFERMLGRFPVGSLVRLSNGQIAVVIGQDDAAPDRPRVLVLLDRTGTPMIIQERSLSDADGVRAVARVDPDDLGIDLSRFVVSGELHPTPPADEESAALVHEPAPGEPVPDGYVDTHAGHHHHQHHALPGRPDPDVAPPFV